jgi:uncharacterized protein YjcR
MPKERDPKRSEAEQIWLNHKGRIDLIEIAVQLNLSAGTIRGWKSKDGWELKLKGTFQTNERNVPKDKANSKIRKGAPKGNTFAKGHGAPKGSKNAIGNKGGHGGPARNTKAIKTGEFRSLWMDALTEEQQLKLERVVLDPLEQINDAIKLYSYREMEMMLQIRDLKSGLSEKQKRVLQELKSKKDVMTVHDEKTGLTKSIPITRDELVITQVEETTYRVIEDILHIEEALTRVSDKKLKAIELKRRFTTESGPDVVPGNVDQLADIIAKSAALLKGDK